MRWQHDSPTKKGYYWFRYNGSAKKEIVFFSPGRTGGDATRLYEGPHYYSTGSDIPFRPELSNRWWPIAIKPPS